MRKILITSYEEKIVCSLCDDRKLMEVLLLKKENPSILGNIYIGKVSRIVSNINAAFVDIGIGEDCYYALDKEKPLYVSKHSKKGLCAGDELIVQVSQEGQKRKHPTVSSQIEFKDRALILTAGKNGVGISSKLSPEQKKKMRLTLEVVLNSKLTGESHEYGFLARTAAGKLETEELRACAENLLDETIKQTEIWKHRVCFSLLQEAEKEYISYIAEQTPGSYQEIVTDIPEVKEELEEKGYTLRFYQDKLLPLAKLYSIEEQIATACSERVWLKSGGYLVIQPTEALTVIDVNTGKNTSKKNKQEAIRKVNFEAAEEAARQMRLRNLSGIILIDFIDMYEKNEEKALTDYLKEKVKEDPCKVQVLGLTKLRLMEITRKKVRKPLLEQVKKKENTKKLLTREE
jgi:ribonuclease G